MNREDQWLFEDNSKWRKFIWSSKAIRDKRTLENVWKLPNSHTRGV